MDKRSGIKSEKSTMRKGRHSASNDLQDSIYSSQSQDSFEKLETSLHSCFNILISTEPIDKNATKILLLELTKLWNNKDTIQKISDSPRKQKCY